MANWNEHIVLDPEVMVGKPVVKGTRLTVELVLERLSIGESVESLLEGYPRLTKEDVLACLGYAKAAISNEAIYSIKAVS